MLRLQRFVMVVVPASDQASAYRIEQYHTELGEGLEEDAGRLP